jgi:hypothetical protein
MVDGTVCGGVLSPDAGIPTCGGACCSRLCAPYGPTGVLVCQPASGCHIEGDLCQSSADCCGGAGSGTPGAGLVQCVINPGSTLGACRSPTGGSDAGHSCLPNGDVCKLSTMSCSKSCDCCAGNCETQDTCKPDNLGIPRCANAQCANAGGVCSSSADCCNGLPCVPNPNAGDGGAEFVCYTSSCVPACGACTVNADCCSGETCNIAQGSVSGTCGPCGGGDAGTCALYGQGCTSPSDCCNGVPCFNGRCEYPAH